MKELQNELRRIKEKEKLLEIPGIYALLSDIIDSTVEQDFYAEPTVPEKLGVIQQVRHRYLKYIRENTPVVGKQLKLEV